MDTEIVPARDASPDLRTAWEALEAHSLERNPYLSPHFIGAAAAHLPGGSAARCVTAWRTEGTTRHLAGLAVITPAAPRRHFPRAHVAAYRSPHTFLTGLLLDADHADAAAAAIVERLRTLGAGLHFTDLPVDGPVARLLLQLAPELGLTWHVEEGYERPCLDFHDGVPPDWASHVSSEHRKRFERQQRKLGEHGPVTWRYVEGADTVPPGALERFLALEAKGWKGTEGSSLLTDPAGAAFFRDAFDGFRRAGDLFFTKLLVGDRVIASSINLRAGPDGFAFKVAYDPDFAPYSPGILNEYGFLKGLSAGIATFRHIDSGATADSFIARLWPDRKRMVSGTFAFGRLATAAASAADTLRHLKRWVRPR